MTERPAVDWARLEAEAVERLRALVRIDSSNPPGREAPVAAYLRDALAEAGIETTLLDMGPQRTNLVARVPGNGSAGGPLLFLTHTDVVPAGDGWRHGAFDAEVADGFVWGRGTLDMKHIVAAVTTVLLAAVRLGMPLERDVIFAATADEESPGQTGAGWLFANHPELVECELAVSEGGDSLRYGDTSYLLIEAAEKGWGTVELRRTSVPAHSSLPVGENCLLEIGTLLDRLASGRFEHCVTAVVRTLIEGIAADQPDSERAQLLALLDPATFDAALARLSCTDATRQQLTGMLFSHATPTILHGGENEFTIPDEVRLTLSGRLLPGETGASWLAQLETIVGDLGALPAPDFDLGIEFGDGPWLDALSRIAARHNPGMRVLPTLMLGGGDVRHPALAGAQAYGFFPLPLASHGESIWELAHARDERIRLEHVALCVRYAWDVLCEANDLPGWLAPAA